jgi:hypothetical protein
VLPPLENLVFRFVPTAVTAEAVFADSFAALEAVLAADFAVFDAAAATAAGHL